MANLNGYHGHLVRRIVADLEFLKESEQLSTDDFAAILARLPRSERVIVPAPPTNGLVLELGGNFGGMGMGMPQAANIQRKMPPPLPGRAMVPTIDPATIGIDTRCRCRATFAYPMGQPDDLPFVKGDIIIIEEEMNDDWWRGTCDGRTGIFPSNHVERLPQPAPLSATRGHSTPSPAPTATSIYNGSESGSYITANPATNGPWDRAYVQQMNQRDSHASQYANPTPHTSLPSIWNEPAKLPEGQYGNAYPKSDYSVSPGPGAMQPFQPPPAQYAQVQLQQQQQQQVGPPPIAPKKMFGGMGGTLGHALVGGVGFGAGSAVAGEAIRGMF